MLYSSHTTNVFSSGTPDISATVIRLVCRHGLVSSNLLVMFASSELREVKAFSRLYVTGRILVLQRRGHGTRRSTPDEYGIERAISNAMTLYSFDLRGLVVSCKIFGKHNVIGSGAKSRCQIKLDKLIVLESPNDCSNLYQPSGSITCAFFYPQGFDVAICQIIYHP
jgi:hypothetical protein